MSCSGSSVVREPAGCRCCRTGGCVAAQCRGRRAAVSGGRAGAGSTGGVAAADRETPAPPAYDGHPLRKTLLFLITKNFQICKI